MPLQLNSIRLLDTAFAVAFISPSPAADALPGITSKSNNITESQSVFFHVLLIAILLIHLRTPPPGRIRLLLCRMRPRNKDRILSDCYIG